MVDFIFSKNCSGCAVCTNICPVSAITMREHEDGFLFPNIDKAKCVDCGKCERVCPHIIKHKKESFEVRHNTKAWIYSSKNNEAKYRSSSGAACYEMARTIIETDGYVIGCAWSNDLEAKHIICKNCDDIERIQGSKYVQSNMGNIYSDAVKLLKDRKKVLFTGTPCQARAMHNFLIESQNNNLRDNLINVALVCHGVASPLSWRSYKKFISEKENSKLVDVNFRDKSKKGYKRSYCCYKFEDGHTTYVPTYLPSSKYIEATLVYNLALRNSCTNCDCKGLNEGIDVIVGDWYKEHDGERALGTNCIVAVTSRGYDFITNSLCDLTDLDYEELVLRNPLIEKSVKKSANRDIYFQRITDYNYWDRVEELYPAKYKLKKLAVFFGIYELIKKVIG